MLYQRAGFSDVVCLMQGGRRPSSFGLSLGLGRSCFVALRSTTIASDTLVRNFIRIKIMWRCLSTVHVETDKCFECRSDGEDVFLLSSWRRLLGKTLSVASLA